MRKLVDYIMGTTTFASDWKESDHPRDDNGKFGEGKGGASKTAMDDKSKQSHADKKAKEMGIKAPVSVVTQKSDHASRGGSASWAFNPITKEHRISPSITIRDDGTLSPDQIEKTIDHELVHIKQSEDGRLVMKKNESKNNAVFWDGKEVIEDKDLGRLIAKIKNPRSSLKIRHQALDEYKKLPWESEAYSKANPELDDAQSNELESKFSNHSTEFSAMIPEINPVTGRRGRSDHPEPDGDENLIDYILGESLKPDNLGEIHPRGTVDPLVSEIIGESLDESAARAIGEQMERNEGIAAEADGQNGQGFDGMDKPQPSDLANEMEEDARDFGAIANENDKLMDYILGEGKKREPTYMNNYSAEVTYILGW